MQDIFGEKFILELSFSAVFLLQSRVSDFFKFCFAREIKGFYQGYFGNEADFMNIKKVSLKIKISKN